MYKAVRSKRSFGRPGSSGSSRASSVFSSGSASEVSCGYYSGRIDYKDKIGIVKREMAAKFPQLPWETKQKGKCHAVSVDKVRAEEFIGLPLNNDVIEMFEVLYGGDESQGGFSEGENYQSSYGHEGVGE